jgi:hypothetical protein
MAPNIFDLPFILLTILGGIPGHVVEELDCGSVKPIPKERLHLVAMEVLDHIGLNPYLIA